MDKQRGTLYRALDDLYEKDRRRKIEAVAADASRPTRLKPDELENRFARLFELDVTK
ncbi:hypothetical protein HKX48_002187 [Thoreauomyces humboldtii]|nr:hypothetical protein HKX48_002187 [Thoreauomyces humboldtii]